MQLRQNPSVLLFLPEGICWPQGLPESCPLCVKAGSLNTSPGSFLVHSSFNPHAPSEEAWLRTGQTLTALSDSPL